MSKSRWGVECTLAVIGTGGPVKRSNISIVAAMTTQAPTNERTGRRWVGVPREVAASTTRRLGAAARRWAGRCGRSSGWRTKGGAGGPRPAPPAPPAPLMRSRKGGPLREIPLCGGSVVGPQPDKPRQ
eukprot:444272-Prorocentrum_minimum.AAC.2